MIVVEAVYTPVKKQEPKFEKIVVLIGDGPVKEVPIKFLRVSEVQNLQNLLREAYDAGFSAGERVERVDAERLR
jgi:hypothetical protein